ncbi:putative quinol monooxygenase [Saccharibacillus alkalitolerans]|uniref:Antibiotic biosynthesis monooxygenase n=1 Tax=Saccharibacillus alkalitolerans TaxID=2705290 RepID=A0ABX0F5U3_9BACL|nr:putative quinol monooxygenase [Saccharibacillus alkalitolerans]NGZ75364.1 antibiotic biosynthesis monooxygenase [Saccharibacillus alkalitolerans]
MIVIHADMQIKPEKREAFLQTVQPLVAGSQAEDGCLRYTLTQDVANLDRFTMIEVWADEAAVERHNASPHFTGFFKVANDFFAVPLKAEKFSAADL